MLGETATGREIDGVCAGWMVTVVVTGRGATWCIERQQSSGARTPAQADFDATQHDIATLSAQRSTRAAPGNANATARVVMMSDLRRTTIIRFCS